MELRPEVHDKIGGISYGVVKSGPWFPQESLEKLMYSEGSGWHMRYQNWFYDLPSLHDISSTGFAFIQAIDDYEDIELFSLKSVQMLVNFHWRKAEHLVYFLKIIPFTLMLVIFTLWSNLILTRSHDESFDDSSSLLGTYTNYRRADVITCYILIGCCSFFLITEVQSIIGYPVDYIMNWKENLTDLVPLILLYVNTIRSLLVPGTLPVSFWVV